ncbi:hypothetical protein E1B28_000907 [Marasmius oreades]|uniref:F-box domain-containing protein n=1 Tax=Marasmius oreades TaxID=181124 RepID=A0A9P7V2B7_9AGAR|nr:uncharacterized protein E1B28_000907 [Marasmius oreades]KAG7099024.1 hypothetical protein E1B28_000907 [Marasmius oreades]
MFRLHSTCLKDSNHSPSTMSSNILNLPVELCCQIFTHLDCFTLARCRQVCKKTNAVIAESSALQYTLELAITGNEDGKLSDLPVAEKLSALRKHQRAWDRLKWNRELRHAMAGGGLWELFGNVLAQQDLMGGLIFRQLPSQYRRIEDKEWRVKPDPQLKVRDFGIDPSQDLLVLVEAPRWWGQNPDHCYRIHLRTMSSCTRHPQANGDVLVHKQESPDPHLSYSIQVSGEHLGILFHSVEAGVNEIIVWNWRSGHIKTYLTGDEIRSFSFLSERHIVVAIVSLSPASDDFNASLLVVDFELQSGGKKAYHAALHTRSLSLPRLSRSALPIRFAIRCDPSPSWTPGPELHVPFHLAHSNRVYAVSLQVQTDDISDEDEGEDTHLLVLFVPQSTLLAYTDVLGKEQEQHEVDWETWGPTGTRFMEFPLTQTNFTVWECYSYGSRYVVKECSSRTNGTCTVLLYDFNRRARVHDTQAQDPSNLLVLPPDETFHVTTPTEIKKIFVTEVSTFMPYRVHIVTLPAANAYCALMCSEDALIVVDENSSKGERQYRLFTF